MRTLSILLFALTVLQCNEDEELPLIQEEINLIENLDEGNPIEEERNVLENKKPLNWPWRGINIESAGGKVNEQTIKELRTSGVNSVRLTIEAKKYCIRNNLSIETGVDQHLIWCKKIIQWCENEGIAVIVESTDFPLDPLKKFRWNIPRILEFRN